MHVNIFVHTCLYNNMIVKSLEEEMKMMMVKSFYALKVLLHLMVQVIQCRGHWTRPLFTSVTYKLITIHC